LQGRKLGEKEPVGEAPKKKDKDANFQLERRGSRGVGTSQLDHSEILSKKGGEKSAAKKKGKAGRDGAPTLRKTKGESGRAQKGREPQGRRRHWGTCCVGGEGKGRSSTEGRKRGEL